MRDLALEMMTSDITLNVVNIFLLLSSKFPILFLMQRILITVFIILIVFLGYTTVLFYFADEPQLENIGHITLLDRHGRILTDSALP